MSGQKNLRVPSRSAPKHRSSYANKSLSNYATMLSEEKDQYIEKLRRRNYRAWEKIQELEDKTAEFWQTIKKQQNLLEEIRGTLVEEKLDFKKQLEDLCSQKNDEIVELKTLLLKERGVKTTSDIDQNDENRIPFVEHDSFNAETVTSLEKLRTTKGDNDYFFHTTPRVPASYFSSNLSETATSNREEIFSELLRNGGDDLSQDELLNQSNNSKPEMVDTQVEPYPHFQRKLEKLNELEVENQRLEGLLGETTMKDEKQSRNSENEHKDAVISQEEELKTDSEVVMRELVKAKHEINEKNRSAKEGDLRIEQLSKALVEAEASNLTQENLIQKVNELNTLVKKVKEDRTAEVMSLTQEYLLEKQQKTRELEKLQQQFQWMKISKLLTINSVATELERLRNAQNIRPLKQMIKTTSRCRLVIPLPSFFN